MDQPRRIAIALGDLAGIGAEMVLKALAHRLVQQEVEPVLFGCRRWLLQQYRHLQDQGHPLTDPRDLHLVDLPLAEPVHWGQATAGSGVASFAWLTAACRAVLAVQCQASPPHVGQSLCLLPMPGNKSWSCRRVAFWGSFLDSLLFVFGLVQKPIHIGSFQGVILL